MRDVLATGFGARGQGVLEVASAIAEVLHTDVRRLPPAAPSEQDVAAAEVLAELAAPSTVLGVLPGRRGRGALCWHVVERAAKPIVVVPPSVRSGHRPIRRALVPLDGTAESATAAARTAALLAGAGVELLVLHVFVQATVPKYWDQPAHAQRVWEKELLARYCTVPGVRMEVRRGVPHEHVVSVATETGMDLMALGWSQQLGRDRARVVRRTATDSPVPVLLVPMATAPCRTFAPTRVCWHPLCWGA